MIAEALRSTWWLVKDLLWGLLWALVIFGRKGARR